ncbi:MAG: hypothetical protein JWQ89_84 [Devosia sp.]|nr:DUF1127 domain-containing protein [Devosia sp.]MDB5538357.1 hypothetical protein [Devosia sp.]
MFKSLTRRITQWSRIHRDIARLQQLDDHILADMGFTRERIATSVRTGVR